MYRCVCTYIDICTQVLVLDTLLLCVDICKCVEAKLVMDVHIHIHPFISTPVACIWCVCTHIGMIYIHT